MADSVLEARVRLLHAHGTLHAGETVRAIIELRALENPVNIAWATAQIAAHTASIHETLLAATPSAPRTLLSTLPVLPGKGHYTHASSQTLLCAMKQMRPKEVVTLLYSSLRPCFLSGPPLIKFSCPLPSNLPASHMGALLRCSHALHVSIQLEEHLKQANKPLMALRVPIRVLPLLPGTKLVEKFEGSVLDAAAAHTFTPPPSFTTQYLYNSPMNPNLGNNTSTVIAKGGLKVGVWRMFKTEVTAGDTLKALFETLDAALNCYAISAALLQHEETQDPKVAPHTQLVAEAHIAMQHSKTRSLALPLPRELTPTLTAHVSVRYSLRVRFVVAKVEHDRKGETRVDDSPSMVPLDQLEWLVPVTVLPPTAHALRLEHAPTHEQAKTHDTALTIAPWHVLSVKQGQ